MYPLSSPGSRSGGLRTKEFSFFLFLFARIWNQLSLVVARTENVFDLYANIYTERKEAHGMPENA
jgi:hypothetical protein